MGLQRFAKDVDEDVERSTRSVPGAYMWVTDETGERKKKCVGVQKIYRSEKDRTLLKQKLAMKTPDFYWRNLDKMREDTRDHFKSMQRLKDMSFREHVKYERKKQ